MDALAENRFTVTKELFLEGMLRVSRESYGKFAKKAALFLGGAWAVLAAVTIWLRGTLSYALIEGAVTALAALWICVLLPRSKARRAYRALEGKYGADMERTTRFFRDRLEVETAETRTEIPLGQIRQVLRTSRLLVLIAEDKRGVLLKLDAFTLGGADTVEDLIKAHQTEEHADN